MTGADLHDDVHPPMAAVRRAVAIALDEDVLPLGDLSAGLLPASARGRAAFVPRQRVLSRERDVLSRLVPSSTQT